MDISTNDLLAEVKELTFDLFTLKLQLKSAQARIAELEQVNKQGNNNDPSSEGDS